MPYTLLLAFLITSASWTLLCHDCYSQGCHWFFASLVTFSLLVNSGPSCVTGVGPLVPSPRSYPRHPLEISTSCILLWCSLSRCPGWHWSSPQKSGSVTQSPLRVALIILCPFSNIDWLISTKTITLTHLVSLLIQIHKLSTSLLSVPWKRSSILLSCSCVKRALPDLVFPTCISEELVFIFCSTPAISLTNEVVVL